MQSSRDRSTCDVPDTSPAGRTAWRKKLAVLDQQNGEARRGLVEKVARRRAFKHLHEEFGLRPESYPDILDRVTGSYLDGTFFLRQMGLFYEVSPALSLTVCRLRQEWIRQYGLTTVPELLLLDQAMLAFFHAVRLNKQIGDMLSLTESGLFYPEAPHVKIKQANRLNNEFDGFVAEDAVKQLQERLMLLMDRFNQMFLRVLRELKIHPISINIGQAGQVNVGQQQVNVKEALCPGRQERHSSVGPRRIGPPGPAGPGQNAGWVGEDEEGRGPVAEPCEQPCPGCR
jgi:hypothetical protein